MVLFGIFIAALMILMTQGYTYGIGKFTITLVGIIIVALLIFYLYEKRKAVPFIDFSIIKNKSFLGATINNFVVNTGTGTTVVFTGYAQQHLGLNETQTGLVIVPYTIMALLMIRFGELAIKRFGGKSMLIAGPLFPALGIIMISMTFIVPSWYIGLVVVAYVICAIGNGLVATPGLTVAVFNMPDDKVSFASGLYKMGATLGGAFGIALNTTIFTVCSQIYPAATAATISFLTGAVMMVLGVISAFILIPKNVKA